MKPSLRFVIDTNVLLVSISSKSQYHWIFQGLINRNLIQNDKDDDKFVDCAIASNADAIITHDKHFNILKTIPFPSINIMNISDLKLLLNRKQKYS
jgi:predicted nucleic acid-binding protein